jgi:hypothetical protein
VIDKPGHHPAERLLYVPDPSVADAEAADVSNAHIVEQARELLMDDLLGDFGFAGEASKANALALLLTPFVREFIGDNPTPLFLIMAPEPGVWSDRELGSTKQLVVPVRNAWVATGNNLDLTDEHARRAVPIILDPGDVRPSERPKADYQHPDLIGWAREHRDMLVEAALTLVAHWTEGEAVMLPSGEFERFEERTSADRTLGSFERWGAVVGGILAAADVRGFLGNLDRVSNLSTEREDAARFLDAWHALGREPMTSAELKALYRFGGELHDALPEALQDGDLTAKRLGEWLARRQGAKFGNLRLVRSEERAHARRWRTVAVR